MVIELTANGEGRVALDSGAILSVREVGAVSPMGRSVRMAVVAYRLGVNEVATLDVLDSYDDVIRKWKGAEGHGEGGSSS